MPYMVRERIALETQPDTIGVATCRREVSCQRRLRRRRTLRGW